MSAVSVSGEGSVRRGRALRRGLSRLAPAVLAVGLAACMSTSDKQMQADLVDVDPPDHIYNEALAALNAGKTGKALEKFEEVDKQHPYSDYARRSMIMNAYLNFRQRKYDEAAVAAKRYVTLFPASPDAAYAQYLLGESYFRRIPDVTRDQDLSRRAIDAMQEVVRKYPDSEYAGEARRKITFASDQMAGKEMQIGRYYLEKRNYLAAVNRFKTVVSDYQTTRHVEEALHRLTESYLALGVVPEARTAAAVLGHNFPDSPWYKDSYRLLKGSGLSPEENQGSWMSRAFRNGGKTT